MRLILALLLVVLSGLGNVALSQQVGASGPVASDQGDASAYGILFRRAILYKKLSDQAEALHSPKPELRRILINRFGLSDDDGASLERLSVAYQGEINPIHLQMVAAITKFRARFPGGLVAPGMDKSPPPELTQLQQQEDAVALRYRDLLRNSMHEEDFQKLQTKVRETFGKSSGSLINSPTE
jgi:hypothetical protein